MYDLFSDFLFGGFNVFPTAESELVCPKCGRSYRDFKKTGVLGCGECYDTFLPAISETLHQLHGTSAHTGKIPSRSADELKRKRRYDELKKELSRAVSQEDYETAAKLHKELKALGDI